MSRRQKWLAFFIATMMVLISLAACAPAATPEVKSESAPAASESKSAETSEAKVVTVAMTSTWDSMMPVNSASNYSMFIYDQIYDRLMQANSKGEYDPRLAESWEVNAESTEVTFHLNPAATWHDGKPLTADDVVFSFQMFSDPEVTALGRYNLSAIAGTDESGAETGPDSIGVKKIDDHTVVITMKSVMYPGNLYNNLNGIYIVPKHIFEGKTAAEINEPTLWMNPVGSGPFKFESKIDGERMEFTANKDYFLGAPKIDRLVVRIVPTANLLAGLMSGEIDILAGGGLGSILLDDWETAQAQEKLVTSSTPSLNYQMLIINNSKPYFTKNVRQAISMAINRNALVDSLLQGQGQVLVSPIAPISPYYDAAVTADYDPDKAKTILEEEKFPFDQEMVFYVPTGNTTRERAAVLIQQDLQAVGIKVGIQSVDFPTLMSNMGKSMHDFGIIGSGGSPDPSESRQMLTPESNYNFCRTTNTAFAEKADEGNAALTFETRKPIFDEYQALIKDEVPMAYLYTTNSLMAYNKRIVVENIDNFSVLNWSTWTWSVK